MKGAAYSDNPTENYHALFLLYMELFSVFEIIVLVLSPAMQISSISFPAAADKNSDKATVRDLLSQTADKNVAISWSNILQFKSYVFFSQ